MIAPIALAFAVGLIGWAYRALQPPPPKICGSSNGPSITSPRIKLGYRASPLMKSLIIVRDCIKSKSGSKDVADHTLVAWRNEAKTKGLSEVYHFFRPSAPKKPWFKVIWARGPTPKHSLILKLAAQDRLKTKEMLSFLGIDDSCCFCASHVETISHIFFPCRFSSSVWKAIKTKFGFYQNMPTLASALKWSIKEAKMMNKKKALTLRIILSSIVYFLWMHRNARAFEGKAYQEDHLIRQIELHAFKFLYAYFPSFLLDFETNQMSAHPNPLYIT